MIPLANPFIDEATGGFYLHLPITADDVTMSTEEVAGDSEDAAT